MWKCGRYSDKVHAKGSCEIGFSSFLLVLLLEVGHSLIASSRTRNSSGSVLSRTDMDALSS